MLGYTPQVSLAPHTTLKTGGNAQWFATAHSVDELKKLVATARATGVAVTFIGGGSNIVVADEGLPGAVIKIAIAGREVMVSEDGEVLITVGAGETFDDLVSYTIAQGWWGLENLSHIPGTVGATPIQNVGAYGVEVAQRITSVAVLNIKTNTTHQLTNNQCGFRYRDSIFKQPSKRHLVIISVTFRLQTTAKPELAYADLAKHFSKPPATPALVREAIISIRAQKFPNWRVVGTAGSFFKNPIIDRAHYKQLVERYPDLPHYSVSDTQVKVPLGWVLDHLCHLRGVMRGTVGTYHGQALVLITKPGATTTDIVAFAEDIKNQVHQATNIVITWEVTFLPQL